MRILICGGGISGLSVALALKGDGHDIELIEKASDWRAEGAGLHLPGNAVRPMQQLGIDRDVADAAFRLPKIRYTDQRGRTLFDLDLNDGDWPAFRALSRAAFHDILRRHLPDLSVRFSCEITGLVEQDEAEESPLEATFNDGSRSEYDLVIGADGIHSKTRALLWGAELMPASTGLSCWRWMAPLPAGQSEPHFMLGRGTVLLVMPVSAKAAYVFASANDPDGSRAGQGVDFLRSAFADFGGAVPELLARLEQDEPILPGQLLQMIVPQWVRGRALLVGDAAHGTLPTMAQGATMAMEDALVLAESLRGHADLTEALQAYQARRLPRAQWVQQQSLKRMGLARMTTPAVIWLRNALMKRLGPKVLASGWRPLVDKAF